MSWHNPNLYLFLSLLGGFATLLAIIWEFIPRKEIGLVEEGQAAPARSSGAIGAEQAEKPLPTQAHTR
jgi:hypothetical protein